MRRVKPEELFTDIELLYRRITAIQREVLEPLGLTVAMFHTMRLLAKNNEMTSADLAKALNVKPQTTHPMISTLLDRGFVRYSPRSPGSGRALPVELTFTGRIELGEAEKALRPVYRRFVARFGREELVMFQNYVREAK